MIQIPTDAESLKAIGLANWRQHYHWPVSDFEFGEIANSVLDALDSTLSGCSPSDANTLLSDVSFFSFLIQHIHARAVARRCDEAGCELLVGRAAKGYLLPVWNEMARGLVRLPPTRERLKLRTRSVAKNLILNRGRRLLGGDKVWCIGSSGRLLSDYRRDHGLTRVTHQYAQLLVSKATNDDDARPVGNTNALVRQLLDQICNVAETGFRVELDRSSILQCWSHRLARIDCLAESVKEGMSGVEVLLDTEPSSPLGRIVAKAALDNGTRVVAFSHGNAIGFIRNRMTAYTEIGLCNEFVCPSPGATSLYADMFSLSEIGAQRGVTFSSPSTNVMEEWCGIHAAKAGHAGEKAVMVIGAPMNSLRYILSQGDFFLSSLEMELQVLEAARRLGFRTLYKMHPERVTEARGLFDEACDEIVIEPFESVWQRADAFVFPCITSTTFGFALTTPRPIVVMDLEGQRWNPSARELLAQRCALVPAKFDSGNKPIIDSAELVRALTRDGGAVCEPFARRFISASPA